jgi:ADP-dependent NAD(P)H-hydrate dehydratase / NAD(P)H-hydrate epimerase
MQSRRPPQKYDHKYSRGVVAIVAGSKSYPGAALLTVGGARRGGAGYIKFLNSHQSITDLVINQFPDVAPISSIANMKLDAIVVGPGATTLRKIPEVIPIVLDSGALSLARQRKFGKSAMKQLVVVTPHEGELARIGFSIPAGKVSEASRLKSRVEVAQQIADELHVICVLKGHKTIIAIPRSTLSNSLKSRQLKKISHRIDAVGGPELATAGSGDILAGLIGAFLASWKPQDHCEALDVISAAVNLHSRAGKHAALHKRSVVATDILESLAHC